VADAAAAKVQKQMGKSDGLLEKLAVKERWWSRLGGA
jgi:hypothetical protein